MKKKNKFDEKYMLVFSISIIAMIFILFIANLIHLFQTTFK